MAFSIASFSTTALNQTDTVTITKPTGVAEGDLLLAQVTVTAISTEPSGWTTITTVNAGAGSVRTYYKVAGAAEPANYAWTYSENTTFKGGGIARGTGASFAPLDSFDTATVNNDITPSFDNEVTPTVANSAILFFIAAAEFQGTTSAYAIVEDDPTWTEVWEISGATQSMVFAYAVRPEVTATGNSSCTFSGEADSVGQLVVMKPSVAVSVSADCIVSPFAINQPILPVIIGAPLGITSSVINPAFIETPFDWTNVTKHPVSFEDSAKSLAVASNISKHSTAWSNQSKS